MGKIIQGPWIKDHVSTHRDYFDSLVSLLGEFNATLKQEGDHLPKLENGDLDLRNIPITTLVQWAMINAQQPIHEHGENNEIIVRLRRDTGNRGPDKEGV